MQQFASGDMLAGRFQLVEPVGRGGTAEVWAARTVGSAAAEVALKIIPIGDVQTAADYAGGVAADVQRLRGLVHPGIVRVFEAFTDGPCWCLVMERVSGGELGQLRGVGFRAIAAAALEVLDALQYAHAQGIVHGDLKPGNVFRDSHGHWRLADFRLPPPAGAPPVSLSSVSPQQLAGGTPGVADDLYAFGALLHDLLAGQPPLHPGITPERIAGEVPARLGVDGRGEAMPPALTQLVASLLEKNPGKRPASVGALRAVLQECLEEPQSGPAGPGARTRARPTAAGPGAPSPRLSSAQRRGEKVLPAWAVYAGAGLLVAGLVAVLVLLPGVVRERKPAPAPPARPVAGEKAPAAPPPVAPDARSAAGQALARFVRSDDAAKQSGADRWGGADWLEARRVAAAADAQYRAEDFAAAAGTYTVAADRLQALADSAASRFAAAASAGAAALDAGDQAAALSSFELALRIRPQDPGAARGLARSRNLGKVLGLMAEAGGREAAGDLAAARRGYAAVLALDKEWTPARSALERIGASLAASAFERDMARGLAALAAGRSSEARSAIEGALRARPGDPGAGSALEQLNGEERRGRILDLQGEAAQFAAAEKWSDAVASYESILAIDATLVPVRNGLEQAQARASLHQKLERELARADRFNDDAVADQARATLAAAMAIAPPGPVLAEQIRRLREALVTAARPVPVQFASDNLTRVAIFKVGPLGVFTDRTVELRPGPYVVLGTRDGYRDVRRTIRVEASGNTTPVDIRCEEPI